MPNFANDTTGMTQLMEVTYQCGNAHQVDERKSGSTHHSRALALCLCLRLSVCPSVFLCFGLLSLFLSLPIFIKNREDPNYGDSETKSRLASCRMFTGTGTIDHLRMGKMGMFTIDETTLG